ncbi:hypothetical protein C0993_008738 [Termitomyces sp. T159_Od127]|nr:hypothetical protein C0993_008738 [Termitomyces sp. T159_Od127]
MATAARKPAHVASGAPSQLNQSSRKGKRAWRKNIDIQDVELGMEEMRAEERVTGRARSPAPRPCADYLPAANPYRQLETKTSSKSTSKATPKILSQRSAVPAVFSRHSSAAPKRKALVSHEEKARLLRIGKRPRKGPFNSVIDPTEFGAGSAVLEISEAVKHSGTYDVWMPPSSPVEIKHGLETVQPKKIKVGSRPVLALVSLIPRTQAPATKHVREGIELQAVVEPHQGTSYNPTVEAHQELLLRAHDAEERRIREAERHAHVKEKMESAKVDAEEIDPGVATGMKLQEEVNEEEEEEEEHAEIPAKRQPARKTSAQRRKAAQLLAERRIKLDQKRELAERALRKRMLAAIPSAKTLRRTNARLLSARAAELAQRRSAELLKLKKHGLSGQRLGKHKVPEGRVDVQLGEDLSESLRALKVRILRSLLTRWSNCVKQPEGNLFRDRFLSMQQRALVEPRVLVAYVALASLSRLQLTRHLRPTRRRRKIIEYEKHAWKRFE